MFRWSTIHAVRVSFVLSSNPKVNCKQSDKEVILTINVLLKKLYKIILHIMDYNVAGHKY